MKVFSVQLDNWESSTNCHKAEILNLPTKMGDPGLSGLIIWGSEGLWEDGWNGA